MLAHLKSQIGNTVSFLQGKLRLYHPYFIQIAWKQFKMLILVAILGQPSVALVGRRSDHVLIPFNLLKAGLHIQRCQNWKILFFNGKEERRAISSKEVIQNAEILFSVFQ